MTQQEKERMFLDLNSVLVKFWIEQGRPDKEIKIELLERMLNWYKKMGYVILDGQSKEPVSEDLEKAADDFAEFYDQGTCDGIAQDCFIAGVRWQKSQMLKAAAMVEGNVLELGETYKDLTISVEGKELNEALQPLGAKEGDRVRMIITIKEDSK